MDDKNKKTRDKVSKFLLENHPDMIQTIFAAAEQVGNFMRFSKYPSRKRLEEYDGEEGSIDHYLEGLAIGVIYGSGRNALVHFTDPSINDLKIFIADCILRS